MCFVVVFYAPLTLVRIETYAGVYKHFGLLHERSYFAHCIHCSGEERAMLLDTQVTKSDLGDIAVGTPCGSGIIEAGRLCVEKGLWV